MKSVRLPVILPVDPERLWKRVDRSGGPDACHPWQKANRTREGYGHITVGSRTDGTYRLECVHRVAFVLGGGVLTPERPFVLHTCDNPPCCNFSHLYAGTEQENVADRHRRGRDARGEQHGRVRLTAAIVGEIREAVAAGAAVRTLAREMGLPRTTVRNVARGATWRHLLCA